MTVNPFDTLEHRLAAIEGLLLTMQGYKQSDPVQGIQQEFIPVQELYGKYCSKPTLYSHVKAGRITLYKLGNRSFVKADEFFKAFHPVNIHTIN